MDEANKLPPQPRYKWPWYLLAAVLLGLGLAVLWMTFAVLRVREMRETNPFPPVQTSTNR